MPTVTTRAQIIAAAVDPLPPAVRVDSLPSGTLALCDHVDATPLALMQTDGEWAYLRENESPRDDNFNEFSGGNTVHVLLEKIPPDAWPAIREEKSQVKRVRIARAACGKNPTRDELLEAAGLDELPAKARFVTMPEGTLAMTPAGNLLALVTSTRCWSYIHSRADFETFNSAGEEHEGHALVTGIPRDAWGPICAKALQLERVRIAVAAVAAAAAAATKDASRVEVTPPVEVDPATLAELRAGLHVPWHDSVSSQLTEFGLLHASPDYMMAHLAAVGIHIADGGSERHQKLHVSLDGWPYVKHVTGYDVVNQSSVLFASSTAQARAEHLLKITRERRMLAHLWTHRGLIRRLTSWRGLKTNEPDPELVVKLWTLIGHADVLDVLGINLDAVSNATVRYHGGPMVVGGLLPLGVVRHETDRARAVGTVLRMASAALWRHGGRAGGPPRGWLADTVPVTSDAYAEGAAGSIRHAMMRVLSCTSEDVHVRVVDTGPAVGHVQAPCGLRCIWAAPGLSALVEVDGGRLGKNPHRRQHLAACMLRHAREHLHPLRNVYLTDLEDADPGVGVIGRCEITDPRKPT